MERRTIGSGALLVALLLGLSGPVAGQSGFDAELQELEALLAEEREEADSLRRAGQYRAAGRILREHLSDEPDDHRALLLSARLAFDQHELDHALERGRRAFDLAEAERDRETLAEAAHALIEFHLELGAVAEARAVVDRAGALLAPSADPRSAWWVSRVLQESGERDEARRAWATGARAEAAGDWEQLLARARCERAAGWFERASNTLVEADRAAREANGSGEADVHAELGSLYFEVYREVQGKGERHSVAKEYREALRLNPSHEGALLGELELYRYNWRRTRRSSGEILDELLTLHPDSIDAHLAAASAALDDGHLPRAEAHLARLEELGPNRREVRTERATLAWVHHRREEAEEILGELLAANPADGRPHREVGRHLCELYRFAEAVPFLETSTGIDDSDPVAWTQLGRALANTGDETRALEAFYRAKEVAAGRQDGWRKNMRLVLERIRDECVVQDRGDLSFVWRPDAEAVLEVYLPEFYAEAREELAKRYGFTPGHVRIEVFREHRDFSTRSTGFEGFPATGVCFGPVVTALSPLSEMRGGFSWARTSFHEFSHVIHLGLSHNRCPRWITEGLATWEELERDVSWTRNMRRDLLDARANGDLIPVRELNAAFRGPRILFGYYQGGLLCEMLIERHGFQPMVRLLEAFDRGLDLDAAFEEVWGTTPEEVDRQFAEFVDGKLAGLALEPRWHPDRVAALRLALSETPPTEADRLADWTEDWITLAWASWQARKRIDAEEALRVLGDRADHPRALFLRSEIALSVGEEERAQAHIERALELGGDDYRARMVMGILALQDGEPERALASFRAAEAVYPGFPDPGLSAERSQWELHESRDEEELAMAARERWLAWNASDMEERLVVARWHGRNERFDEAARRYREINDVDPFRRGLHREWGRALWKGDRLAEALREYEVALLVPPALDADVLVFRDAPVSDEELARAESELAPELTPEERARALDEALGLPPRAVDRRARERLDLLAWRAEALLGLERADDARELARSVLASDPEHETALAVLGKLDEAQ